MAAGVEKVRRSGDGGKQQQPPEAALRRFGVGRKHAALDVRAGLDKLLHDFLRVLQADAAGDAQHRH